ncbi:hypothetical protein [Ramlibacter sp.]|uniref:hypothetical protein n=1 Tax=Ramlibacter sp. TaxID=1917967 RepID=UPI001801B1FB|nr:hypothetical protein [Ramlibacter sp.]MBA2676586.1 hypothetical protein [Ramlibacter sp.]
MSGELLDLVQWPAMLITLLAAWLVGSQKTFKRNYGFWCFIASNVLWIAWGWHTQAWALIVLQVGLFVLNLRAAKKTEEAAKAQADRT